MYTEVAFLESQLDYILFLYGLALLLVGVVCLTLRRDGQQTLPWFWLGLFGLIYGTKQWLEIASMSLGLREVPGAVLRVAALLALVEFGRRSLRLRGWKPGPWIHIPLLGLASLGSLAGLNGFIVGCRYGLLLPGGLWAALAILHRARQDRASRKLLTGAGTMLLAYILSMVVFVPKASFPPASLVNEHTLVSLTGVPLQLLRAGLVAGLCACLYRYRLVAYQASQPEPASQIHSRSVGWYSAALLTILACGWVATHIIGRTERHEREADLLQRARLVASALDVQQARQLTATRADLETPAYRQMRKHLSEIRRANQDIRFISVYTLRDGRMPYYLCTEPENPEEDIEAGDVWDGETLPRDEAFFRTGQSYVSAPYLDSLGTWVSGIVPVLRDPQTQRVTMALSLDIAANDWDGVIAAQRLAPISITALISALLIGGFIWMTHMRSWAGRIAASESRYRSLIEGSPNRIELLDEQGRYLAINGPGLRSMNWRESDVLERPFTDFWPPEVCPAVEEAVREALTGQAACFEAPAIRADGWVIIWQMTLSPVTDPDGRTRHVVAVGVDITERKEALERVTHLAEEARRANAAKSDFLANMSHEIRTPLTAILGYTELLRDDLGRPEQQEQHIRVIRRNGEHLLGLINDILDLSKIEAGKLVLDPQRCRVHAVLADVLSMMRVRAAEKRLDLTVRYRSAIPETILADEPRLRQCLVNLVGNAVKFTETGSVTVDVSCMLDGPGGGPHLRFEVIDTGIGIHPEALPRLFDPFMQADSSTSRRFGGTGLGLTITRRIVEKMGGTIDVQSEPGVGSTFGFTTPTGPLEGIPMIDRPQEVLAGAHDPAALAAAKPCLQGLRVLLAEDGPDNQRLIMVLLRRAGAEVTLAENGRQAVEKATAGCYDLVLMDMQMPEMDGYQATRLLCSQGFAAPIIALTAHALAGDRDRCLQAGCTDYISKPIDRAILLRTLERYAVAARAAGLQAVEPAHASRPARESEPLVSQYADDPALAEVLGIFVQQLPQRLAAMRDARRHGDYASLQRLAHQLKGSGGGYGYAALSDCAQGLEQAARTGDAEASCLALEQLANLCERIRRGVGSERLTR